MPTIPIPLTVKAPNLRLTAVSPERIEAAQLIKAGLVNTRVTRGGNIRVTRGGNTRVTRGAHMGYPIPLTAPAIDLKLMSEGL